MKRVIAFLLSGTLLLVTGCAYAAISEQTAPYDLYFREAELEDAAGEDALRTESIRLEREPGTTRELAEMLIRKLLDGPTDESLKSTIPDGTSLLSLEIQLGRAIVDLSSAYGTLSGVELTLADYAITLTLTQLTDISSVKITVQGQELAYREKQVFKERDVLMSPQEDVVGTVPATLYFQDSSGTLTAEERTLELYEGDTQVAVVARALELGPETKGLLPVFPEGFRVKSLWPEEQICYVNLPSALISCLPEETEEAQLVFRSLEKSLCSLESVKEVRFLVDGEFAQNYGEVPVSEPYRK